ncbi:hypothetical protein SAMN05660841_01764, partial [Sphingobacterium nematocida]
MLSFEEFFIKKKIDLFALKSANQELYKEFEVHYRAMGEKSFDHSKKFWFNKLRKSYLLAEEVDFPKTSSISAEDIQAAKKSPTLGFKPKFAPKPTSKSIEDAKTSQETSNVSPSGFKPRFKPGIVKTTPVEEKEVTQAPISDIETPVASTEEAQPNSSKPAGFKP